METDIDVDPDASHHTALILNASGLAVKKDQSLRIITPDGSEIWAGVPSFAPSLRGARAMDIAGIRPLVLRVARTSEEGSAVIISESGARELREATGENPFMDSNCVVVVN